jgi:hypothetical protein
VYRGVNQRTLNQGFVIHQAILEGKRETRRPQHRNLSF